MATYDDICWTLLLLETSQNEAVALGGRAAEELFVGKISTGASDDLDKAPQPGKVSAVWGAISMGVVMGVYCYGVGK